MIFGGGAECDWVLRSPIVTFCNSSDWRNWTGVHTLSHPEHYPIPSACSDPPFRIKLKRINQSVTSHIEPQAPERRARVALTKFLMYGEIRLNVFLSFDDTRLDISVTPLPVGRRRLRGD